MSRIDPVKVVLYAWLGGILLFMLSPLVFVVVNSFNASPFSQFPPDGLSLRWYGDALSYQPFLTGFRQSMIVGVGSTLLAMAVGVLASIALVRYRFRGRSAMHTLFVAPMVVPKVALGLAAFILFLQAGEFFNAREVFVGTPLSLTLVHALISLPLVIVIVSASLVGMDPTLEDAAADLGASPRQTLFRITLPIIRSGLVIAAVFAFNHSFDEIETAIFLSPLAGQTLPVEMFLFLERRQDPTLAALSTIVLAVTFILVIVLAWRFGVERVTRSSGGGQPRADSTKEGSL